MIQWIAESAGLLTAISALATFVSRRIEERERKFAERTVHDVKQWAETPDGQYWFKGYLGKLERS